tara:strand:- start:87341 stop:92188 length:4848 start_codon:yes stop_codon:yes gene_type:complete
MSKTGSDLLVDVLKENELWSTFADIAQRVFDRNIGNPLKEFANIRNIDQDTDSVFVERAIRQAGLNLTHDFFEQNREKLTRSFYQLIKFWEVDGNPDYPKFIKFLLGRDFDEQVLYTNDDVDLYHQHGTLLPDGGDWYSSSHVDLSIDGRGLEQALELVISNKDTSYLRQALGYSDQNEAGRAAIDSLIDSHRNRTIDPSRDDPRIVRALIEWRVIEVYYQFAPIEKVVRSVYLVLPAQMTIEMFGSSIIKPKIYVNASEPVVIDERFVIPSMVQGFRQYPAHVLVTLSDGTQVSEYPTDVQGSYIKSFDGKSVEFKDIDFVEDIEFTYTLRGKTSTVSVQLYPIGTPFIPDSLQIVGPVDPKQDQKNVYKLITRHDNVREFGDPDRITWHIDSDVASFDQNVLHVTEIFEPVPATVSVVHRNVDGTQSTQSMAVTLVPAATNNIPKRVRIILEQDIDGNWIELDPQKDIIQGMAGVYLTAQVDYTDGSTKELYSVPAQMRAGSTDLELGLWESSTSASAIKETGEFDIPIVYRDFDAEFTVVYQDPESERMIKGSVAVHFKKPRLVIEDIQIIGPDTVIENTRTVYQLLATWSNGMQTVVEADWFGSQTATAKAGNIENGLLVAQDLGVYSEQVNINARISVYRYDTEDNESVITLSASKTVTVNTLRRELDRIEVVTPQNLNQGNTNRVRFYADWNDSSTTQLVPYRIELKQNQETLSVFVRDGNTGTFEHTEGVPVILSLAPDLFEAEDDGIEHQQFQIDYLPYDSESTLRNISGLVNIHVYYINPLDLPEEGIVLDSETLDTTDVPVTSYSMSISVAPKIYLSTELEIVYVPDMAESSRVMLAAMVTYENGEIEQARAVWTISPSFDGQEIEADLSQGMYTLDRIVEILIGVDREWLDSNTLTEQQVSKLIDGEIVFKSLAEETQADWTQSVRNVIDANWGKEYPRAVIQTRPLEDGVQQSFTVTARYFQQEETVTITNNADELKIINTINSSRIEGPGEIYADNTLDFSYGLVIDYEDGGESYMVSNNWRVEVANKREVLEALLLTNDSYQSLLPTKADLSIYTAAELTEEQLSEVFENIQVAEIDNEGYLYPRININAQLIVYADYDDFRTQFTEQLSVYMKSTNAVLVGMYLNNITNDGSFERNTNTLPNDTSGANKVIRLPDVPVLPGNPDSFAQIDPVSQRLYYQFRAKVERTDDQGTFYDPEVVEWSLETSSSKVSLAQPNRNVIGLLVSPLESDTLVTIKAVYTEEFPRSTDAVDSSNPAASQDRVETVASSVRVIIESSKAIDVISRTGQTYVYDDPDSVFVPTVSITRRDGTLVANPSDMVTWYTVSGPVGLVYDQERDGFIIPKLTQNTAMVLKAVAQEGTQTISREFEYSLIMQFVPQSIDLIISSPVQDAIIDAAEYELGATLIGTTQSGQDTQDASDSCFYYFDYNESDASLEENTLVVSPIAESKTIEITIRSKDYPSFEQTREVRVYSSYPIFGAYLEGITDSATFNSYLDNFSTLTSRTAGTFEVNPNSNQFGYFAHPKSLGRARFTYIPENNSAVSLYGNWDGAERDREGNGSTTGPIEVTRVYEDGLTETWYLYRTQLRGFSRGRFAVRYDQE